MEKYLKHLAKVLVLGGGGWWCVEGGLLIGCRRLKTLCWIGWRLSQPSPKAVLHLLQSPSGQVRVGNPRRSRALAQSGCRGGSFFFVDESTNLKQVWGQKMGFVFAVFGWVLFVSKSDLTS